MITFPTEEEVHRPRALARAGSLLGFAALAAGAATVGARATSRSVRRPWYALLRKPRWQPPSWTFGPVWTGLYAAMAFSGHRVATRGAGPARRRALGWWGAQLALNAAWSPLFFGLRRPRAALVDAAALTGAVALYARAARRVDRAAAWVVVPYLAWSAFATALNGAIVRRNAA